MKKAIKILPVRVSTIDRDGDYFPDGSEQFTIDVNLRRSDPLYDVLWKSFVDRKPAEVEFKPAKAEASAEAGQ